MTDDYALFNAITGAFTAIGTVGATWLAARTVIKSNTPNIQLNVGNGCYAPEDKLKKRCIINIWAAIFGTHPISIQGFGIESGIFFKTITPFDVNLVASYPELPINVDPGKACGFTIVKERFCEQIGAAIYYSLSALNWRFRTRKRLLLSRLLLPFTKIVVSTAEGQTKRKRLNQAHRKAVIDHIKKAMEQRVGDQPED